MLRVLSEEATLSLKLECSFAHTLTCSYLKSPSLKTYVSNLVTCVDRSYVFEWYAIRCDSKKRHQKDMCSIKIASHALNMITSIGSIVSIIGGGT